MALEEALTISENPIVNIGDLIGFPDANAYAVLEFQNPGGSHKDRPVVRMLNQGVRDGNINQETAIIEYTTGSAGISIARICQQIGLRAILVMPEAITVERERLIRQAGAELILTPRGSDEREWVRNAASRAVEIQKQRPNSYLLNQSQNTENKDAFHVLGEQIMRECHPDYIVVTVGTGATAIGIAEIAKTISPKTQIIGVDPCKSASTYALKNNTQVTYERHKLYGSGPGIASPIVQQGIDLIDAVARVDDEEAYEVCRELKRKGMSIGPTSGASVMVIRDILTKQPRARIATVFFDQADRYRSANL